MWRFYLCESPSPGAPSGTNIVRVAELSGARDKQITLALNRAGSASFSIRADDDHASEIQPWVSCLLAVRDGDPVWSGPVATISGSLPEAKMNVTCVGWLDLLAHRDLREQKTYTGNNPATGLPWTDADIAYDVLTSIRNVDSPVAPPVYVGNAIGTRQNREITWPAGTKAGDALRWLTDIEAGIDIAVDPITRNLDIKAWNSFTDRPKVHFGYNWGPHNLVQVGWTEDGVIMRNRVTAVGEGGIGAIVEDSASIALRGLFEETISLTNVRDQEIVDAYAAAEVAVKGVPLRIYSILPKNPVIDPDTQLSSVPRIFSDFEIGDQIRFSINYGWLHAEATAMRVFGATVQIDENGNEKISQLQISP